MNNFIFKETMEIALKRGLSIGGGKARNFHTNFSELIEFQIDIKKIRVIRLIVADLKINSCKNFLRSFIHRFDQETQAAW